MTNPNGPETFVDFIANLPIELTTQILLHLIGPEHDWPSIWPCLIVSRTWQMRILRSSIWRVVRLDQGAHDMTIFSFAIPAFMDKVEELGLASMPLNILLRCLRCLTTGGFSSLKSLSLEGTTVNVLSSYSLRLSRLPAARMLTHLSVKDYRDQSPNHALSVSNVLSTCPNLTHLSCAADGWLDCFEALNKPTNLVRLELRYRRIMSEPLQQILQQCPKLRSLLVDQCFETSFLSMIRRVCPNLSALCYNMYSSTDLELPADAESNSAGRGLRHFYISSAEGLATYPYRINDARAYMDENCSTLQDFRINVPDKEEYPGVSVGGYSSFVFSKLHTIHCYDTRIRESGDCDYSPLMANIINLSPNLEQLKVEYFEGLAPIFYALENADKLRHLELTRISLTETDSTAFLVFLKRQVSRPTIKNITITRSTDITDTCLTQLASIGTIRELRLCHQENVTPRLLSSYASMDSSTEKMIIEGLQTSIDDNLDLLLQAISQMMFLKSISVTFNDNGDGDTIPIAGLRYLLQHSKSIRYIQINESTVKRWCRENATEAYIMAKMAKSKGITVAGMCTIY